jgi:NDP-sugar pyrophosphorylase family protein
MVSANPKDVIILAGGLGTRLKGLIPEHYPKVMTLIAGKPFLEILLRKIASQKIARVILALGFGSDAVIDYAQYLSKKIGVEILISIEPRPLGTAGALKYALPLIQTDPFIVMNGDTFSDVNLDRLLNNHLLKKADATIGLVHILNPDRFGIVEVDKDTGRVIRFSEKSSQAKSALISAGTYVFSKSLLNLIPSDTFYSLELAIFPRLVGKNFYGFDCCTKLIDIGTPESLQASNNYFGKL